MAVLLFQARINTTASMKVNGGENEIRPQAGEKLIFADGAG